ncbi:MAG: stage III sporulation protein AE [Clostridiales bacterium]
MGRIAKVLLFLLIVLGVLLGNGGIAEAVAADGGENAPEEQAMPESLPQDTLDLVDTAEMERFLANLDQNMLQYQRQFRLTEMWQAIKTGQFDWNLQSVLSALIEVFLGQLKAEGLLLWQMLALSLLCVLLSLLKSSFSGSDISLISTFVAYLLVIAPAIAVFSQALLEARAAVSLIGDFIYALLPVLLPLLAAIGGVTTVAVVNPLLALALGVTIGLMRNLIFPLIYFSAVLQLIGRLSPRLAIDKLASLFKDVALGVLSITMTVFVAFLSLSGMATASIDGLAVKAAKTATGIFIPVVGRSLADAMDSVLATALVLKNWIGFTGAVALLFICALPALKLLVQALLFKLAGAMIQPLGDQVLAEALTGVGKSFTLLFGALAISGLFAYFGLALLIGAGNLTMMLR